MTHLKCAFPQYLELLTKLHLLYIVPDPAQGYRFHTYCTESFAAGQMTGIKIKISNNHTISIINSKVQNTTNKIGKLQIETYTIQIGKKYNTNTKLFNTNRKIIHFIWKLQQCKWKRSNFVVFIISSGIKFRRFVNNNSFLDT